MLDSDQIKDWDGKPGKTPGKPAPAVEPEAAPLTPEQLKARNRRGQWIALALFAFVILLFALTITKIGGNVVNWGATFE
jgi:hypothetical protein